MSAPTSAIQALQAGSATYKLCVLIEGYPNILTDATAAQAVTAWSGAADGKFTAALSGLVVDLQQSQKLDPLDPLQSGGQCTLYMPNTPTDEFAIATHQTSGGVETELTATLTRTATTMTVASTINFPSSGILYCGTEAIGYSGKTLTTFTGLTRGYYSPFANGGSGFGHEHNVGFYDFSTARKPVVSSQPRSWLGRWVGVWLHHLVNGTPCTASNALLLYAGKITAIRDDTKLHTTVELRHVLDVIKEYSIGSSPWTGELARGMYFPEGWTFTMRDGYASNGRTANPLTVKAVGAATPPNEIEAGYYAVDDVYNFLNLWLNEEIAAARLYATYYLVELNDDGPPGSVGNPVTKIRWRMPGTAGANAAFELVFPSVSVAEMLGYSNATVKQLAVTNTDVFLQSDTAPTDTGPLRGIGLASIQATVKRETGVFVDNFAVMPSSVKPSGAAGLTWGIFSIDGKFLVRAARSGSNLINIIPVPLALAGFEPVSPTGISGYASDVTDTSPVVAKQLYVIESTMAGLIKLLLFSTGTSGYNDATWDLLGSSFGLAIPALILSNLAATVDALPGAGNAQLVTIDKPMKLGGDKGVLSGELMVRRAFPIWKLGSITFGTWQTPTAYNYVAALTESTKAESSGVSVDHRTVAQLTEIGMKNSIKLEYNRDITRIGTEAYADVVTLVDAVAIDDAGGEARNYTISARNTYTQYAATGSGIELLIPQFLASLTLFSRPLRVVRRSIDPRYYEGLAPGDVVLVSDSFARDPATGRRGISARPGLVISHRYNLGGAEPGNPSSVRGMAGEVDIVFLDLNRIGPYAPSARIDETASTGGFTAGYDTASTIRCKAHEYSDAAEVVDASRFVIGDKILIVEIDPSSAGSPLSWSRTVSGVSSNDITFTGGALASFSTSKKYMVTYDHYAVAQTTQQVYAFQADTDSLIEDLAPPFQYGYGIGASTTTASTDTDPVERYASVAIGDGKPRDVGYDRALCRLLNNLHDHKTRHVGPTLSNNVMTNTTYSSGAGYRLLSIQPVWLTREQATTTALRYLSVAPFFRSSDGTSVTIRVTLTRVPPNGDTLNDVGIASLVSASATWTTSSTTWQTGAEADLNCNVKHPGSGLAYLLIESTIKGECRGLGQCNESERVPV